MKNLFMIFILLLAVLGVDFALAQEVAATPAPTILDKIFAAIPGSLPVWAGVVVAFLSELVLRIWPTAKPKSLLLVVAYAFKVIAKIFDKLSTLCDGVIQNVKQ